MYSYICYGLDIRSTLRLPELEQGAASKEQRAKGEGERSGSKEQAARSREQESKTQEPIRNSKSAIRNVSSDLRPRISDLWQPDVSIHFGRVERLLSGVAAEGSYFRAIPEETQLFWDDVVTIKVRSGREITIDPVPGVQEDLLRHLILGPALAALLHQRGLLVLHASAVAIDDGAIAFLGGKGWGKSSLAGILYSRGYGIAADDVTAVHLGRGCARVVPAFPQLKLWPDTAASLGSVEELPELYSGAVKLMQRVDRGFTQTPLPLRCIYVLAQGKVKKVEPLAPGKAFLELVRHSYWAELLQASGASAHFLQCVSVSKHTPVRYLRIPRSLALLPDVARLVEEDIIRDRSEHTTLAS